VIVVVIVIVIVVVIVVVVVIPILTTPQRTKLFCRRFRSACRYKQFSGA